MFCRLKIKTTQIINRKRIQQAISTNIIETLIFLVEEIRVWLLAHYIIFSTNVVS